MTVLSSSKVEYIFVSCVTQQDIEIRKLWKIEICNIKPNSDILRQQINNIYHKEQMFMEDHSNALMFFHGEDMGSSHGMME